MFGIGGPELVVILVVALIFVGPDKLPQVARTLATGLRDLRRAANVAQAELRETVDDLMREVEAEPAPARASSETDADKLRDEARKKAADAVAKARAAAEGARSPDDAGTPSDTADATAQPDASVPTPDLGLANAAPDAAPPPIVAPEAAVDAPATPEQASRRRRDLNDLLAEEARKIEAQRAEAAANDAAFVVRAPDTVARGTPARKGSAAEQLARAAAAEPTDDEEADA
ncbi:MAG: twin-arginine translocation pathway protein TatB [Pseudomonadota bacterium]